MHRSDILFFWSQFWSKWLVQIFGPNFGPNFGLNFGPNFVPISVTISVPILNPILDWHAFVAMNHPFFWFKGDQRMLCEQTNTSYIPLALVHQPGLSTPLVGSNLWLVGGQGGGRGINIYIKKNLHTYIYAWVVDPITFWCFSTFWV